MRRSLACKLAGLAMTVLFMLMSVEASSQGATFRNVQEGENVPSFTVTALDGAKVTIDPADNKLKALFFVKLEQENSVKLIKDARKFCAEVKEKGGECFFIVSYSDTVEQVKEFVEKESITEFVGIDADRDAYEKLGLFVFPSTAIVSGEGKMKFEYSSYDMTYSDIVGGKLKVLAGLMTEEEYKKLVSPEEGVKKSEEQKEADRLVNLGKRLASRGLYEKAAEKFRKAVEKDPTNVYAKILYGESLTRSGKEDEAIGMFEEVLKENPMNREAKLGKGIALISKGDYDGAIAVISETAMLNPEPQRSYYWLGVAYEKKGDFEKAAKYYKKALDKFIGEK